MPSLRRQRTLTSEGMMTYEVDFERSMDIGDARFWLVRAGRRTSVLRQWLDGDRPGLNCNKEVLQPEEIPAQLIPAYNTLCSGGIPAVS